MISRQMLKAAPFVKTDCGFQFCIGLEPDGVRPHSRPFRNQRVQHRPANALTTHIFLRRHFDDFQPLPAILRVMMRG